MQPIRHVLAFVVLLALLAGCTGSTKAYSGSRDSSELASLRGFGIRFVDINGVSIPTSSSSATIASGPNDVRFTINSSNYLPRDPLTSVFKIHFDALAGNDYIITGERGDGRLCAFPEIPETGRPDLERPAGCIQRE